MTLKFKNQTIPGTHGLITEGPIELHLRRTYFYGLKGESEIVSGYGGRPLYADMWIHNSYSDFTDLNAYLATLDKKMGDHGTLETTYSPSNGKEQTFEHCTFLGFERLPLPGRDQPGALEDVAGTVDGGWFINGRLHFHQLKIG